MSEKDMKVFELFKRICKHPDNYVNVDFGVDHNMMYIDGCIDYLDEEEKELIHEWVKENNIETCIEE